MKTIQGVKKIVYKINNNILEGQKEHLKQSIFTIYKQFLMKFTTSTFCLIG